MESAAISQGTVQTPNGVIRDPQVPDAEMMVAETEEDSEYEYKLSSKTAIFRFLCIVE